MVRLPLPNPDFDADDIPDEDWSSSQWLHINNAIDTGTDYPLKQVYLVCNGDVESANVQVSQGNLSIRMDSFTISDWILVSDGREHGEGMLYDLTRLLRHDHVAKVVRLNSKWFFWDAERTI